MIETSKDILYLVIAFCVLWLTVFLCWALYYMIRMLKQTNQFLEDVKQTGYSLTTKQVKYITVFNEKGQRFKFRKCDFDIEICIQVHDDLAKGINSFVFFSGDGDFEPLYQLLHRKKKQVVVVYASGHTGREVLKIERKIYLCNIKKFIQLGYA